MALIDETMCADRLENLSGRLAVLKRRGSNLLVVSGPEGDSAVCEHLLGDPESDRRAVFVPTTVGVSDVRARWHGPEDPDRFGVVDVTGTRAPNAVDGPDIGPGGIAAQAHDASWYRPVDATDDFAAIGETIRDSLTRLAYDDPPPGTIRLCLDSLDPFLDVASDEAVFRLLHVVTASVRTVNGLGHVHLPEYIGDRDRTLFEPLFDATVTVESSPDGIKEQWRLHESGYETGWLAV